MTDLNPHRPEWVRWIPAALLSVVIIAAALFALIAGPRLAAGPGPAETDQVTDLNWSVFTDEGLQFIESARTPRIDLGSPPIDAAAIGLAADGTLVVGPHVTGLDYRLVLIAADEQPKGALFTTPQFSLTTVGGRLESVRIEQRGTFTFRETFDELSARVPDLGFVAPASRALAAAISEAREGGAPVTLRSTLGTTAAIGVTAEVTCFGSGFCSVSYVVTPAVG